MARTPEELKDLTVFCAGFASDPLGFVYALFNWGTGELTKFDGPDKWQIEILEYIGERLRAGDMNAGEAVSYVVRVAVASGHGIGKSALVSWIILWAISTYEDTKGVVTANTEKQLITKTWAELSKWHRLFIAKECFELTATALFSVDEGHEKTWRIDMIPWSLNNTESFAGLHNKGKRIIVIYDEASAIPDPIWEVTEGALTDADTQILWFAFGNPTRNEGRFKENIAGQFRARWHSKQIDGRDVAMTNKELIQEWIDDYGVDSDFVKVRVRGMFPSMSVKQFISVEDADKAFGKHLREDMYNFAPKILTCDPAAEGDDKLIISLRQGLAFKILREIPKNDNDVQIASLLAMYEDEEQADAVILDGGYGTGIKSAGKTMGREHWMVVWFAGASPDIGCLNMRAYMWKKMKEWLKEGGAIPKDKELYQELISPEVVARLDGKIQIESKKEMKKRGVPSPNKADSLAISFAFPVTKKSLLRAKADTNGQYFANNGQRYDPLKRRR